MPDAVSAAEWITAGGTAGAAIGTVGALIFAAKAASAASASADAANRAVQAEALPLLLDVPYEHYTDEEREFPWPVERDDGTSKTPIRGHIGLHPVTGTFSVPVRNVGRGVARIEHFELALTNGGERYAQHGGKALPAGEDFWLAGRPNKGNPLLSALQRSPSPLHGYMPLIFSVTYTDNSGMQKQRLEMGLGSRDGSSPWRVLRTVHLHLDGE